MVYLTNNEEKEIRKFYLKEQGEKLIIVKDVIKNLEKLEGPLKNGQIITPETLKNLVGNLKLVGINTSDMEIAMETNDPAIQYSLLFIKSGKGRGVMSDLKNVIGISESPEDKKPIKEFYGPEPYIVKIKVNAIDEHHAMQQVGMYRFNEDDIIGAGLDY
tara:strand:+ start:2850 stop:3329 length:480 start_codon:yes stop_codon:yes gene_type:complete